MGFALAFLFAPGLASAECNFASISNSQWRLQTEGGASWLVTPCGDRFFSVGINGLDPAQLNPPTHLPRTRHTWLPLPAGRTLAALIAQAAQAGITLAPPGTLRRTESESLGVRLCLGAPATEADLERALVEIRRILEMAEAISFV